MTTQAEIAGHLDLSVRSVREHQKSGVIPKGAQLDTARRCYIRHLRAVASGHHGGNELSLTHERAALAKVQREKIELDVAERRKELVGVDEVTAAWVAQVQIAKGRLLSLPSRCSGALLAAKTLRDIERILTDHICKILTELASGGYKRD